MIKTMMYVDKEWGGLDDEEEDPRPLGAPKEASSTSLANNVTQ